MKQTEYEGRLLEWSNFRKSLEVSSDPLQDVIDYYNQFPQVSIHTDPYSKETWPDPWELLWNGQYDENTIALGMAYTLELCDWPCEILLIQDPTKSHVGIVIRIDNKFVLNHNYGLIDDATALDKCEILNTWYSKDLVK